MDSSKTDVSTQDKYEQPLSTQEQTNSSDPQTSVPQSTVDVTADSATADSTAINASTSTSDSASDLSALVFDVKNEHGNKVKMSAAEYGKFIHEHYCELSFNWIAIFRDYYDSHLMNDVRQKLTSGMDEISCKYVDHHDVLLNVARAQKDVLIKSNLAWTQEDLKLFKKYEKVKTTSDFFIKAGQEWGSSLTNKYGLYDADSFVPDILERINGKDVIDGGGFIGDTLVLWNQLFPKSKLHTFEPGERAFYALTNMCQSLIKHGKVIANKKALGDKPDVIRLNKSYGKESECFDPGASIVLDYKNNNFENVEVITLDSYVAEHNLNVGLIKLDVEGFEPQALLGAMHTITTQRPLLVIACYHTPFEFYELKPKLEELNLNYHFELRRTSLTIPLCDLGLIGYPL